MGTYQSLANTHAITMASSTITAERIEEVIASYVEGDVARSAVKYVLEWFATAEGREVKEEDYEDKVMAAWEAWFDAHGCEVEEGDEGSDNESNDEDGMYDYQWCFTATSMEKMAEIQTKINDVTGADGRDYVVIFDKDSDVRTDDGGSLIGYASVTMASNDHIEEEDQTAICNMLKEAGGENVEFYGFQSWL